MNIRHYFTHFSSLGGVQSILNSHLTHDAKAGLNTSLLAYFDENQTSGKLPVSGLQWNGWTNIRKARKAFKRNEAGVTHDCCVYHDLWGMAFLADLDSCSLRIGAIHSHWPHLEHQLNQLDGFLDGVFCDSQDIADLATEHIPSLDSERAIHLPVPIKTCPSEFQAKRDPMENRPMRLGFVGRVDHLQKRVERFIPLVKALEREQIPFELEFLGSGTAETELKQAFQDKQNVLFHGRQSGLDYWRVLSTWDYVVYTSDFEGSPLAMQEALNAGCIPIFPRIQCGGDNVVESIHPDLLYQPEDYASIAKTLKKWQAMPHQNAEQARKKGISISNEYAEDKYHLKFMEFLNRIQELPRLSKHPIPTRVSFWTDRLPFAALRRWFPKAFFNYRARAN